MRTNPKPRNMIEDRQRCEIAVMTTYRKEFERKRDIRNANADRIAERRERDPLEQIA